MASKSWIRRLFAQKKSPSFLKGAKTKKAVQIPLDIELLEIRQLLSVTANFASSTLTLTPTLLTRQCQPKSLSRLATHISGGNTYVFVYNDNRRQYLF